MFNNQYNNYSKLSEIIEPSLFSRATIPAMVCVGAEEHRKKSERVLVFSELGISRAATAVIAYLIHRNKCSFKVSAPCYFGNGGAGKCPDYGMSQTLASSPGILEKGTHCLGSCVHYAPFPQNLGNLFNHKKLISQVLSILSPKNHWAIHKSFP